MERFTVSMNSEDIDLFERRRADMGFSKSAFIRYLIAEHENNVPNFIQYKHIIEQMADLNTHMKEILVSKNVDEKFKMQLFEEINSLNDSISENLFCAKLVQNKKD